MRAFIYDKYGYYPENEDDTSFMINQWKFELLTIEKTEDELGNLDEYLKTICGYFPNSGAGIIKNRDGNYLSKADFGDVVLLAIKQTPIKLDDVVHFHVSFQLQDKQIKFHLHEIISLWEEKVDLIEKRIIPSIKIDDFAYSTAMEITIHAIGLAENAIQYLSEQKLDLGDEVPRLTLCHKRLNTVEASTFLNPFNLVVDSPMRDLAELYKSEYLNTPQLMRVLSYYSINTFEASLLFARILFPTCLFDCLEDHYGERKDVRSNIIQFRQALTSQVARLKDIHQALVNKYQIRPISWLLEQ